MSDVHFFLDHGICCLGDMVKTADKKSSKKVKKLPMRQNIEKVTEVPKFHFKRTPSFTMNEKQQKNFFSKEFPHQQQKSDRKLRLKVEEQKQLSFPKLCTKRDLKSKDKNNSLISLVEKSQLKSTKKKQISCHCHCQCEHKPKNRYNCQNQCHCHCFCQNQKNSEFLNKNNEFNKNNRKNRSANLIVKNEGNYHCEQLNKMTIKKDKQTLKKTKQQQNQKQIVTKTRKYQNATFKDNEKQHKVVNFGQRRRILTQAIDHVCDYCLNKQKMGMENNNIGVDQIKTDKNSLYTSIPKTARIMPKRCPVSPLIFSGRKNTAVSQKQQTQLPRGIPVGQQISQTPIKNNFDVQQKNHEVSQNLNMIEINQKKDDTNRQQSFEKVGNEEKILSYQKQQLKEKVREKKNLKIKRIDKQIQVNLLFKKMQKLNSQHQNSRKSKHNQENTYQNINQKYKKRRKSSYINQNQVSSQQLDTTWIQNIQKLSEIIENSSQRNEQNDRSPKKVIKKKYFQQKSQRKNKNSSKSIRRKLVETPDKKQRNQSAQILKKQKESMNNSKTFLSNLRQIKNRIKQKNIRLMIKSTNSQTEEINTQKQNKINENNQQFSYRQTASFNINDSDQLLNDNNSSLKQSDQKKFQSKKENNYQTLETQDQNKCSSKQKKNGGKKISKNTQNKIKKSESSETAQNEQNFTLNFNKNLNVKGSTAALSRKTNSQLSKGDKNVYENRIFQQNHFYERVCEKLKILNSYRKSDKQQNNFNGKHNQEEQQENLIFRVPNKNQYIKFLENYQAYDEKNFSISELLQSKRFKIIQQNDSVYFGEVSESNGFKNGKGIFVSPHSLFEGNYLENNPIKGTMISQEGIYKGTVSPHYSKEGHGCWWWWGGKEIFIGNWLNGIKQGFGIWRSSNGESFQGEWRKNRKVEKASSESEQNELVQKQQHQV